MYSGCVVELEVDILDDKGPNFVAKSVGIEVALGKACQSPKLTPGSRIPTHLERQPRLNLVRKYFRDRFVEVGKNLHGQLGFYPALGDEIVKGVREGPAHAAICQPKHARSQRVQAIPASPVEFIVLGGVGHGGGFALMGG